jgi:hypothetical protein
MKQARSTRSGLGPELSIEANLKRVVMGFAHSLHTASKRMLFELTFCPTQRYAES